MRTNFLIALIMDAICLQSGTAQFCAFDEKHRALLETNSQYRQNFEEMEKRIYTYSVNAMNQRITSRSKPIYTIPVVIHLIVPPGTPVGQGNNLSDRQVELGLDYLNQSFANSGPFFSPNGVDIGIQFCLARRDPNGQATNGITRTTSQLVNELMCNPGTDASNDAAIKNLVGWDCSRYLNFYLVTDLFNNNFGCSLAGYAYFPGAPCSVDGIVQESRYWNSIGGTVVTAHEVGHYFSLNHTFNGGCTNGNCLTDGDRICDTPPDNSASFAPCNTNSCNTDIPDLPDDNSNYMDYSSCSQMHFTAGQKVRMVAALETARKSLLVSNGCLAPGNYDAVAIELSFSHSVCTDSLCPGIKIRNDGLLPFSTISLSYQLDGNLFTPIVWNGLLIPGQMTLINLPCIPILPGVHQLDVQLGHPDNQMDFNLQNNSISLTMEIFEELKLTIDSLQPTHCISDGKLWAHTTGGSGNYVYRLDKRAGSQTNPYFQLLLNGNYNLFVQDSKGCTASQPFIIPDSCSGGSNKKFITNGNARPLGKDCYLLTEETFSQTGSVWYEDKVSLYNSFDIYFDLNLGCLDGPGADGIAFVFQPISTSLGVSGGGLGYQGISPSLSVEFDSYQNPNYSDPFYDHMAIIRNGNVDHSTADNLAGPVGILPGNANAEDCKFHKVLIRWRATDATLLVYVDCILKLQYSGNVVRTIFNNDPNVYFGFTAATGGSINVQQICLNYISGITSLPNLTICEGESIQVSAKPNFAQYRWRPSSGVSDTTVFNPVLNPDSTTSYSIHYKDACGFDYVDSFTLFIKKYRLNYELMLLDSCGSFSGALVRIIENPEDSTALYGQNGIDFYKQLYFEFPEEGVYTIYTKTGNCILPEIIEVKAYNHRLRDSLIRVEAMNCRDSGRILVTGLEGKPPYQYRINGGSWQTQGLFEGLTPGNYQIEIRDSTSCNVQRNVVVGQSNLMLQLRQDSSKMEISCCNPSAYIAVTASGSFPYYHYSLDQGAWEDDGYFFGLGPGSHQLVARDEYGCSTDTLHFFVIDNSQSSQDTQRLQICQGEVVRVGNNQYTSTGTYTDIFQNIHCCDSVIITDLLVYPVYYQQNSQQICEGESIQVGNKQYSASGIYIDSLQSIHTCDSIIQTNLIVHPVFDLSQHHVICNGDTVYIGTSRYTTPGNYVDSLLTAKGCDSVIRSQIIVNPRHSTMQEVFLCKGEKTRVGNHFYNTTGRYRDSLNNVFGCDSIVETLLYVDTVGANLVLDSIRCYGDDDAAIMILPTQGISNFQFALDDTSKFSDLNTFGPLVPGNYRVFIKDSLNCIEQYSVVFFQPQFLTIDFPLELKITLGDRIQLQPILNFSPATAHWNPSTGLSCSDCTAPFLQALVNKEYEVVFTNEAGCEIRTKIKIYVNNQTDVYLPNVFSPNGDQINDRLVVFGGPSIREIEWLRIFDRWGNQVFENRHFMINDEQAGWDGTFNGSPMNPSVFVYQLKVIRLDGSTFEKAGDITLMR